MLRRRSPVLKQNLLRRHSCRRHLAHSIRTSGGAEQHRPQTDAFRQLVEMYHHCLAESAGEVSYQGRLRSEMELPAESVMWTHFRFLTDMLHQLGH
jgi:hypothetical protein